MCLQAPNVVDAVWVNEVWTAAVYRSPWKDRCTIQRTRMAQHPRELQVLRWARPRLSATRTAHRLWHFVSPNIKHCGLKLINPKLSIIVLAPRLRADQSRELLTADTRPPLLVLTPASSLDCGRGAASSHLPPPPVPSAFHLCPVRWVFEGVGGGREADESVQSDTVRARIIHTKVSCAPTPPLDTPVYFVNRVQRAL